MDHAITVRDLAVAGAAIVILGLAAYGAFRFYVAVNGDL